MINRRFFMGSIATAVAGLLVAPGLLASAATKRTIVPTASAVAGERYKIAVVDLMILKRQKLGAFELTKAIGADGVEVDMGGLGNRDTFDSKLADPAVRQQFLDKARELNLEICSLAMSGFYAQSFAERPTYKQMLGDCIETMKQMNVKVAFLPLGVKGDLVQHPELRPAVIERLKVVGKMAEEAGVVIGIETSLDAKGEKKLLKEIDSPAVQSYFNFSNALKAGRDLHKELAKTVSA
jgi:sugar phosphate isomerase/epimerase